MNTPGKSLSTMYVFLLLIFIILVPLLPVLISWQFDWWEAWVFAAIYILGFVLSRVLAARKHPDIIKERAKFMRHTDTKSWDKVLAPLAGFGGGFIPLVAGLDARFQWSGEYNLTVKFISLFLILAGFIFGSWALIENRFFSGTVRIQSDRGHKVVSTGPYRWMRHPGYSGAMLTYLVTPLFLDSSWTFIPVWFIIIVLIIRTYFEDNTLKNELEGYREYAGRVRYRLIPGIW